MEMLLTYFFVKDKPNVKLDINGESVLTIDPNDIHM